MIMSSVNPVEVRGGRKHSVECGQLLHIRQFSHKKVCDFLVAEGFVTRVRMYDLLDVDTTVIQLAGDWVLNAIPHYISLHAANPGDACDHTGAVCVSKSAFNIIVVVVLGVDSVLFFDI